MFPIISITHINPTTKIRFSVASQDNGPVLFVQLIVHDILGNGIVTFVNEEKLSGNYEVEFNTEGLTSSIYFRRLQAGSSLILRRWRC